MAVYFISGIDTDSGKTVATGTIARSLLRRGVNVITQKLVQTGCECMSDDILTHRKIMEMGMQDVDLYETTCPYVFSYPASPHLAAEIDGKQIDTETIHRATVELENRYDIILLEGAGGLYVPLTRYMLTIEYIRKYQYPLILVTSSKLGSINHTLMSLELCRINKIDLKYVIYNDFPNESEFIKKDTLSVIRKYLEEFFSLCRILELPVIKGDNYPDMPIDIVPNESR